jgi:membrane protein DedA with SNARE-associated domain
VDYNINRERPLAGVLYKRKGNDIEAIVHLFERYALQLPLELFVLLGSFTEEVISPIPSFVVMIPAGAAAQVQGLDWWYLGVLGLIGGAGRTIGSLVLYFVADKAENWLLSSGRRFFGVNHKQMERYGRRFSGKPRDLALLLFLNAAPVIPTSLLSLTCGFIKIRLRTFIVATFFGASINAVLYLGLGYAGVRAAAEVHNIESGLEILALVVLLLLGGLLFYRIKKKRGR